MEIRPLRSRSMIIEPLFERIELKFDEMALRLSGNMLVVIPLIIAAGFATAGAAITLVDLYGPARGYLILAAGFAVLGLFMFLLQRRRLVRVENERVARLAAIAAEDPVNKFLARAQHFDLPTLLADGAKSTAPLVAKFLMREGPKNLGLAVGAGIGLYVAQKIVDMMSSTRES
ncbi:hypothetical protein V3H18_07725 [Methylocystis sp. 9N]|uniref:Uncharacterized protein n=1 Tax=Methylocystis borbori TaxID=3118750 RepID=A0ABU7XGB1_9HYPH